MTLTDFNAAKNLQEVIGKISGIQNRSGADGVKAVISIVSADGRTPVVEFSELKSALGNAFDTICATALASLNTELATLKSSTQASFDALANAQ